MNYVNASKPPLSNPEPTDSPKASTGVSPHQGEAWQQFGYKKKAEYDQAIRERDERGNRRTQALVDNLNRKTAGL